MPLNWGVSKSLTTSNNLKNHHMRFYLERVREKMNSAERVPYRNNFNLFNLFGKDQAS